MSADPSSSAGDSKGGADLAVRRLDKVVVKRFVDAFSNGDVVKALELLEANPLIDLDEPIDVDREYTPLMLACENVDAVEMVRELVEEFGVDVNKVWSENRMTPLHIACRARNGEAIEILLDAGADVSTTDICGRLPLHWACRGCVLRSVKSIARRSTAAMLDQADDSGYTPLMVASEHGRPEIAMFLIAAGVDATATNKLGHDAAELADWFGNCAVLEHVDPSSRGRAKGSAMRIIGPADMYQSFGASGQHTSKIYRERRIFPGSKRPASSAYLGGKSSSAQGGGSSSTTDATKK